MIGSDVMPTDARKITSDKLITGSHIRCSVIAKPDELR